MQNRKILFIYPTTNIKYQKIVEYIPLNIVSKDYFLNKSITFPVLAALTPKQYNDQQIRI